MNLSDIAAEAHANESKKGFLDRATRFNADSVDYEKIALMHTELSEAVEALRDGNLDGDHGVVEELADTVIRICGYCSYRGLDIAAAVEAKLAKNRARPHMHGRLA